MRVLYKVEIFEYQYLYYTDIEQRIQHFKIAVT